ncbi:MAG: hypothetical protein HYY23_11265 [Verrucomicrobia bacterium]|nr:hypothetical protein [Verrucomicrobiota bacterium]
MPETIQNETNIVPSEIPAVVFALVRLGMFAAVLGQIAEALATRDFGRHRTQA